MDFVEALADSVDEALSVLGDQAKQVVYLYLENIHGLKKNDIPYQIDQFSNGLELLFGSAAAIIQSLIMKSLFRKIKKPIKLVGKPDSLEFNDYIQSTRIANLC
ncbi:MAG: hypothetical protein QCH99_07090 [Candidatus Bathyarchaeota archaeon]|nr:hypothetical protein [Candidatus Bathyarchaeum tardum]